MSDGKPVPLKYVLAALGVFFAMFAIIAAVVYVTKSSDSSTSAPTVAESTSLAEIEFAVTEYVFPVDEMIRSILPIHTDGAVPTGYNIYPPLPEGLTLNEKTGRISGTPTEGSPQTTYTVNPLNGKGETIKITVQQDSNLLPTISYAQNTLVSAKNALLAPFGPTLVSGQSASSYAISPALPTGMTFDTITGVIGGTPSMAISEVKHSITPLNASGTGKIAVVTITIVEAPVISYPTEFVYGKDVTITSFGPTLTSGSPADSYAISGTALSAGLTLDTNTGIISGTPTGVATIQAYTIVPTNIFGAGAGVSINITVIDKATLTYPSSSVTWTKGTPITPLNPTSAIPIVSYSVLPALPVGVTVDTSTGIISGTPTVTATSLDHVITPYNQAGYGTGHTITIVIN